LAGFNLAFTLADLSSIDYFHPNIRGQNLAAATSWNASYWH
jgi:hypothetical protein